MTQRIMKTVLPLLATFALLAASCYYALDASPAADERAQHGSAPAAARGAGAEDPEHAARVGAAQPLSKQSPEHQRRYYESWIAALERSQQLQQSVLQQLEQQRGQAAGPQLDALDQRIRAGRDQLTAQSQKLDHYRTRLAEVQ